ncbi:TetR family transcriptional regulator [Pseudarthrobacter sp. fls2-241-R2A-127]|uniref:TetR/AcrR family transcriptional regulator n=1 Tax=Pseudarthrobacter sp. fls2-241-R2A-127 TaxID=3040303 RepID=UPI0025536B16|nr:TetR family transcriptional regulator [Pseudarthrobacter sp. fls2-241-R2A-127]
MPDRRTELMDAALGVVAEKGMKGLTHRAVDAAAGLPEGTTSNYFRSRAALVQAAVGRLLERDSGLLQDAGPAGPPSSSSELAAGLAALVLGLAREHAGLTRARMALSLDRPAAVTAGHHLLVSGLQEALEGLGVADAQARARDVADYCDGLLLHLLTVRRDEQPAPVSIAAAIERLLGP